MLSSSEQYKISRGRRGAAPSGVSEQFLHEFPSEAFLRSELDPAELIQLEHEVAEPASLEHGSLHALILLELLREQPFHPSLHSKRLSGPLLGLFSFRITRDWRVMFQFTSAMTIQLLRVAHRSDIYR